MRLVSQQRDKGLGTVAGSLIKRILVGSLAACGLLLVASSARANDIYFAQNASGSANGTDCADAYGIHDTSRGINISSHWVPGNTLHICGSITLGANTNAVTAQAGGASGSPITIKFEPGAVLSSPYWPGDPLGCVSSCAAIDTNNFSYITIDGGTDGLITATANGSSLANRARTMAIYLRGEFLMVKNMTITNIYVNSSAEPNSQPGNNTADIRIAGNSNVEVCNNTLNNAHVGVWSSASSSSYIPAPTSLCTSGQSNPGTNIYNNTLQDHGWQMNLGGNGYMNIFNNDMSNWANWFYPTDQTYAYHLDGIIVYGGTTGSIARPYIYNNYIHGDFVGFPTGFIFCTYGVPGSGSACTIFNNLLVGTGHTATAGQAIYFHSSDGNPLGPHMIYNNTISGFSTGQIYMDGDQTQHYTVKNNIFLSSGGYYFQLNGTPTANYVSNYNVYYGARTICGYACGFNAGTTLATWQGKGEDLNSVEANPSLDTSWRIQSTSSAAYARGINLATLNLNPLNFAMPSAVGVNGVAGPARSTTATRWDSGAFIFGSGATSNAPAAPQNLAATVN